MNAENLSNKRSSQNRFMEHHLAVTGSFLYWSGPNSESRSRYRVSWLSSFSERTYRYSALQLAMTTSFHMLSAWFRFLLSPLESHRHQFHWGKTATLGSWTVVSNACSFTSTNIWLPGVLFKRLTNGVTTPAVHCESCAPLRSRGRPHAFRDLHRFGFRPRPLAWSEKREENETSCLFNDASSFVWKRNMVNRIEMFQLRRCHHHLDSIQISVIITQIYITANVPSNFFTVARTCCCSEQKIFTRSDDCAAIKSFFCNMHNKNIKNDKLKNSSCAATIQCAREHFSYCAAAHSRSLEGTLITAPILCSLKSQVPSWSPVKWVSRTL
jgi:hypothetical protein